VYGHFAIISWSGWLMATLLFTATYKTLFCHLTTYSSIFRSLDAGEKGESNGQRIPPVDRGYGNFFCLLIDFLEDVGIALLFFKILHC